MSLVEGKTSPLLDRPAESEVLRKSPSRTSVNLTGKIIVATLNRPTGATGVHTHTRSLIDGLRAEGFPCDVVTPFSGSSAWKALFAIRPLLLKRIRPTWGTLWYRYWHVAALRVNLRKELSAGSVSQIIAQCPPSARVAMDVLTELNLRDRIPVTMVCHFNGSEADEYRAQGALNGTAYTRVKDAEERALSDVDRVIYVSAWARQLVEEDRGIHTKASSVIWNGISDKPPKAASVVPSDLGLSADDIVLINVGTLEPRKDQIGLVRMFKHVVAEFPKAKLVLVGEGPHRPLIETAAKELGIASNVVLLGHRNDVPALLEIADLYVHFASAENCPISLIEASRAGLPWAANPAAGVRELLNPLGGVALDPNSVEQSLVALRPLLSNANERRAIGAQNKARFASGFTQAAMVDGYLEALGLDTGGESR